MLSFDKKNNRVPDETTSSIDVQKFKLRRSIEPSWIKWPTIDVVETCSWWWTSGLPIGGSSLSLKVILRFFGGRCCRRLSKWFFLLVWGNFSLIKAFIWAGKSSSVRLAATGDVELMFAKTSSPSRWRIASTIVWRFGRDMFVGVSTLWVLKHDERVCVKVVLTSSFNWFFFPGRLDSYVPHLLIMIHWE